MAKILIKNGPPEFDMIHAYFRQDVCPVPEVEMTLNEEGDGMTNVYYVRLDVMIPWTSSTKTWKFRATVEKKEDRVSGSSRWKAFIGTYSFQTRTGEGRFVTNLCPLKNINLGEPADDSVGRDLSDIIRNACRM